MGFTQAPGTGGPDRHTCWLGTVGSDGRPHVVGVGVFPSETGWYFTSGPGTRKSRNLAHDPRCTISVALDDFDLTVEGTAVRVTDEAELERFAAVAREGGWPAEARDGAVWAEFERAERRSTAVARLQGRPHLGHRALRRRGRGHPLVVLIGDQNGT